MFARVLAFHLIFRLLTFTGGVSSQLRHLHAIGGGTLISTVHELMTVDRAMAERLSSTLTSRLKTRLQTPPNTTTQR